MEGPQYPEIRVSTRSPKSLTLVAAVRQALREAKVDRQEIDRFTAEALSSEDPNWRREVCSHWVRVG